MTGSVLINDSRFSDEKGRLYFYDNAKFVLIFLVVLAHALSPFKTHDFTLFVVWKVINTIHMPLMIFISGFFAKRYIGKSGQLKVQRTFSYFMLYIFSQLAVSLFEYFVLDNEGVGFSVFRARSSLWFLMCLGAWYLVLPFFSKFKPWAVLIAAIIFGLVIGYDDSVENVFSLSRIIVHFPFFMAGYFCTPELISKINNIYFRLASVPIFALCVIIIILIFNIYPGNIITCNFPYSTVTFETVEGAMQYALFTADQITPGLMWLLRLAFYALAFVAGTAFLAIIPRRKVFFTRFGSRTLQVYILHRFPFLCWINADLAWWKYFSDMEYGILYVVLIAVGLTFVLSLKPFEYPFKAIQKIPVNFFIRKENKEEKA